MPEQIKLGVMGGLGDVTLTRKYPFLINSPNFSIVAIADTYPKERTKTLEAMQNLLEEIETQRLKKPISPEVKAFLARGISEGRIGYFQVTNGIPQEVFDKIGSGGVLDISTPNKFHCDNLEQTINDSYAHIVVEKPVVVNREQLDRLKLMYGELSGSDRVAMDGEHYSYYDNIIEFIRVLPILSLNTVKGGLGKITSLDIKIEENEDFSKDRNRATIDTTRSGGGIWLDLGPHALSFLYSIGARINLRSTSAVSRKVEDSRIADAKYGETQMEVLGSVMPSERFAEDCTYHLSVGKAMSAQNKRFIVNYERGRVILNMDKKGDVERNFIVEDSNGNPVKSWSAQPGSDAFANMFKSLYKSITGWGVLTPLSSSLNTLAQLFEIYDLSKRVN